VDITIYIGDHTLSPAIVNSLLVTAALILFFIICNFTISRADPTKSSKGFMFLIEFAYDAILNFISDSVGDKAPKYVPFIFSIVSYLIVANLLGLIGLAPPTTNLNVTVALTIFALTYILLSGIFAKGLLGYLKDTFIGDVPAVLLILFIPINIVGELSKIISLSIRLFGNIVSGTLLMAVVLQMLSWFALPLFPIMNGVFDIFAGLLQALIFATLVMIWMKDATERAT